MLVSLVLKDKAGVGLRVCVCIWAGSPGCGFLAIATQIQALEPL